MPFKSLGLHPLLVRSTRELEYTEPTPVQAGAIPPALEGRDVLATAQTGTGKTAAFLLPILHRILSKPRPGAHAVIISPTRELAEQIEVSCRSLARFTNLRSTLIVGGKPMDPQVRALRSNPEIIVATPGRLLDLMMKGLALLNKATTVVLDEADMMLDMGFLPDVKRIIAKLPARNQTMLFSATMPPVIARLANELLKKPATVQIGKRAAPAVGITQAAYPVPTHLKISLLRHLLRHTDMPSVLIFSRTKHGARKLARLVEADGFSVAELHSNRTPSQRTRAMEGFRQGRFQVMVATNIAARGLDVNHITHVISTDVPDVPEDYVHRIGRTGRAGAEGDAFILVSPEEERSLAQIERQVGQRLPRVTLPDFDYTLHAPKVVGSGVIDRARQHPKSSRGTGPNHGQRPAKPHSGGGRADRNRSSQRRGR